MQQLSIICGKEINTVMLSCVRARRATLQVPCEQADLVAFTAETDLRVDDVGFRYVIAGYGTEFDRAFTHVLPNST